MCQNRQGSRFIAGIASLGVWAVVSTAGPNQNAVVAIDYDPATPAIETAASPQAGSQLTVAIVARNVKDLCGYSFTITFDPQAVQFVGAQAGPTGSGAVAFLESHGGKIGGFFGKPGIGRVEIAASIGTDTAHAVSGSGVLALVTLKKTGVGPLELGLADVRMITPDLKLDAVVAK